MDNCVQIAVENPTPRHDYIFSLIFNQLLGISYCYEPTENLAHISYTSRSAPSIQCVPHGLLSEKHVRLSITDEIAFDHWNAIPCFFRTGDTSLPFDIFSAAFFLVSRYEEWLPYEADIHNRFPATASILYKNNLLAEPIVNQWALELKNTLLFVYPHLTFNPRKFEYLNTLDIDQAWKFKGKGVLRNVLGSANDVLHGRWENTKNRWLVLLGLKKDPFFEVFKWLNAECRERKITTVFFILLGDYGKFDKNIPHDNTCFVQLVQHLHNDNKVGIHPSYNSNINSTILLTEIQRLKSILNKPIHISRQHFLMHTMPQTYRNLLAQGIQEDYTMGYSTHLGFRAGIAAPFFWYDLEHDMETTLKLVPFCAMDITPMYYRKESPKEAKETLRKLLTKTAEIDGLFVSLWHNESLSETGRWRGWRIVYEDMLQAATEITKQTTR